MSLVLSGAVPEQTSTSGAWTHRNWPLLAHGVERGPLARSIPFGVSFIRVVDGVDVRRPLEAAEGRRVFELHAVR